MGLNPWWSRRTRDEEHAERLFRRGDFEEAAACFERLLGSARDPSHPVHRRAARGALEARVQLGLARFHLGRDAEAESQFARALAFGGPGQPRVRYLRARVLHRSGRTREAIAELERALATDSSDGEACLLLAVCESEAGHEARAGAALDRTLDLALPETVVAAKHSRSADDGHRKPRRAGDALDSTARAVREHPCYPDLRYRLATLLFRERRLEEAEIEVERALRVNPDYLEARLLGTRIRLLLGAAREAARRLESMVEGHPHYPDLHFWLALALFHAGEAARALAPLERAVSLNRHFSRAQRLLGLLHHRFARRSEALRCLRRGLVRDRELGAPTWSADAPAAPASSDESGLQRQLVQSPEYPDLHLALARARRERGDLVEARAACDRALALHPEYAAAALEMARLELELGKPGQAERLLVGVVRRRPRWADAHGLLGQVFWLTGKHRDAEGALRAALRLNPDYAEARRSLEGAMGLEAEAGEAVAGAS